jgi:hypothetical protein
MSVEEALKRARADRVLLGRLARCEAYPEKDLLTAMVHVVQDCMQVKALDAQEILAALLQDALTEVKDLKEQNASLEAELSQIRELYNEARPAARDLYTLRQSLDLGIRVLGALTKERGAP